MISGQPPQSTPRVINQQGIVVPEHDRAFADMLRRMLLKAIALIEDRYQLDRVNLTRTSKRLR